jgi:conjugal transfer ATP-binding protein TraC
MGWLDSLFATLGGAGTSSPGKAARAAVADWLSYRSYDPRTRLYHNAASVGFLLEVTPLIGGDDRAVTILTQALTEGYPAGTCIGVWNIASPQVADKLNAWFVPRYAAGGVYHELARNRRDHLARGAWSTLGGDAPFLLRTFRTFVGIELATKGNPNAAEQLKPLREALKSGFGTLQMGSVDVEPAALVQLVDSILAPTRASMVEQIDYSPYEEIARQCARHDTVRRQEPDRLAVATERFGMPPDSDATEPETFREYFDVRAFAVRSLPAQWAMWDCARLIGDAFSERLNLPCPVVTTLAFRIPDQEKAVQKANLTTVRKRQQVESITAKFLPVIAKQAEEWREVSELMGRGVPMVDAFYGVLMLSPWGEGDTNERTIRAMYRGSGWDLSNVKYLHLQGLYAALPLNLGSGVMDDLVQCQRTRKMMGSNIANIVPLQGEYLGGPIPHMVLVGRRGQPFFWSPLENAAGNHNVAIFGKSGSGKSVFLQELCASMVGAGATIIVIDDGRSFQNSGLLQGARHIDFTLGSGFSLNVFRMVDAELIERDADYRAECMSLLKTIVGQMARFTDPLDDEERGHIDRAVNEVWNAHGSEASIDAIIDQLRGFGEAKASSIATSMQAFASSGTYGAMFTGIPSFSLNDRFTIFELSDLATHEELRAVVLTAIMFMSNQAMVKLDRSISKALIIDEAWQLLRGGSMANFVEGYARTCRKYGSCLVTATQSLEDYYKSDGSRAALENSDWFVVLEQKPETISQFAKAEKFEMNDHVEELLRSLKRKGNLYSDVLIRGPDTLGVGRLVIDRFSAAIYSSSPEMFARISELRRDGHELVDVIYFLAEGRALPPLGGRESRSTGSFASDTPMPAAGVPDLEIAQ